MSRDHQPIVIEEFNGLWQRGDEDSVPLDHFSNCNNVQYFESGFETRDGLDTLIAQGNVLRIYNYKLTSGESLLILDTNGDIYHALLDPADTVFGPILSITAMTDFNFHSEFGRAYITPFRTETDPNGISFQRGLENDFVYVYKGDGTAARKAAGNPPSNSGDTTIVVYNSTIDGLVDKGIHIVAVTFGDGIGGDSTALGPTILGVIYAPGEKEVHVDNLPIGGAGITERFIWMTQAIDPEAWDPSADLRTTYTFFLAKTISDNTTVNTILSVADTSLTVAFAAGALPNPTSGGISAVNSNTDGFCDLGLHVIGVIYETDTGYLTAPGPEVLAVQTFVNEKKSIDIASIPLSPDSFVTKRHLVSTIKINNFNGDDKGFQLFFIPGGNIENNIDTTKTVDYYDADLIDDASHLIDNFAEIPAGVVLKSYHGRMLLAATFDDISLAYLSAPGEPEAIDQIDGQIIMPLDGNPITNAQEYRDVLYLYKKTRTSASNDNGDVPSTWPSPIPIDQGIGASIHGVATVLDSGGVNVDFLLIVDFSGIMIFNGAYARPELTWKIQDFWRSLERDDFANIQLMNDSLRQILYMTLPDKKMLIGDYENGLNAKNIKWGNWSFDIETTSITLIETNTVVIGAQQEL